MSIITATATAPALAALPSGEQPVIKSINDLIVNQAKALPNVPLVCYPDEAGGWKTYTAKNLDDFADEAAKELANNGLLPTASKTDKAEVVALLSPSTFDYVVSLLALSRMGFAVLLLSTRLPTEAYISLLTKTACTRVLVAPSLDDTVAKINAEYPLLSLGLPTEPVYKRRPSLPRFRRSVELVDEEKTVCFIVHSSGSTGLPKPIFQSHQACLSNYASGTGMRGFVTLPLFHNHGLCTMFRGIVARKPTMLYGAGMPLTNANLVRAMDSAEFDSFHAVPYALKVLAETEAGIAALRSCKLVLFGGSSCPDELGDKLVANGVYVVSHYGATEMGQLMTSSRAQDDPTWNYVRPLAKVLPYLRFDPVGPDLFECVVLDGLPTKVLSSEPDGSYRTRDTFTPHPTLPDAWKYIGRLDDRVTLVNGEKVLPIPYEHRVRQSELVKECLVFGVARAFPGLLVVPSTQGESLSKAELLEQIQPFIERANEHAESFARIPLEMVEVLDPGTDYPATDKGTVIRAASYMRFEALIEALYTRFETAGDDLVHLDSEEALREYLHPLMAGVGVKNLDDDTDFFAAGTDSLQAITARGHMMRQVFLSGTVLGNNVVFEHPSIRKLARFLHSLNGGSVEDVEDEVAVMRRLVEKYSDFKAFTPGTSTPDGDVVLLTGATGSLGAHILSQLLPLPYIRHIYVLARASTPHAARNRVLNALSSRALPTSNMDKLTCLPSDLSLPDLGLGPLILGGLRSELTQVIHSAWAVNFNLGVSSFEAANIAGVRHLLDLCLSVPHETPARLAFVSSVSAAAGTPLPAVIPEALIEDPSHAQAMGYARSKWVAEHIVGAAGRAGVDARVLRAGQLVGDSVHGMWNPTEAIPLMLQTAVTLGVLPLLDESPSWLPMDIVAGVCIELSGIDASNRGSPGGVYHVQNPTTFSWNADLIPALSSLGLDFTAVPQREWVARLRDGEQDPEKNPAVKLLDFYAGKYDNDRPGRKGLEFDMRLTRERSPLLDAGFDVVRRRLMAKCLKSWEGAWKKDV